MDGAGVISFRVNGIPAPKGSARAFYVKRLGRAVITAANSKTKPWEQAIRSEAGATGCEVLTGPVRVAAVFVFPRVKGHFSANGGLRLSAPATHTKKPDADKLLRSAKDAMSRVVWRDDALVVEVHAFKRYAAPGEQPRAEISVSELGQGALP